MTRILLTSWGSRGDVEPLAALARELRLLGAEAVLVTPPDDDLVAVVERAGASHVPLEPSVRSIVSGERPPGPDAAFKLAAELVAARFEVLGHLAPSSDALVATGLMPAGAPDVAELAGIPYTLACFHPFGLPSPRFRPAGRPGKPSTADPDDLPALWREDAERVDALYAGAVNEQRARRGLPPVTGVRDQVFGASPLLAADPLLAPWADSTDLPLRQTGAWMLPDDRSLPAALAAFLDAGEPPVYVGFGSMMMRVDGLDRIVVDAVRAQGRRLVLSGGWAGLAADEPDCFVVGEANHQALFARCAAVVHHGSAGTTTTAARAGVPQVLVPQIVDQPHWAARVAELGIGVAHDGPTPTEASLSAGLAEALTLGVRAREVAGEIRTDGAAVAARLVLESVRT